MTTTHPPRFIALSAASQNCAENVLFYDSQASLEGIFECANARLDMAIDLLETLHDYLKKSHDYNEALSDAIFAVCVIAKLLLNDTMTLLRALKVKQ